jgi:hypothetical protein
VVFTAEKKNASAAILLKWGAAMLRPYMILPARWRFAWRETENAGWKPALPMLGEL